MLKSNVVALKLLEDAFDNALNAKYDTIKRLADLKLKRGDDPYMFSLRN